MADTLLPLLGKKGAAEVVRIFAAVTNSDKTEGRGVAVDNSYHETETGARYGAVGIGWGLTRGDGTVEERLAVRFEDGTYLLLRLQAPAIQLADETTLRQDVRRQAIAKLSPAERAVLGVTDAP